jgi:hypothetical protein
MSHPMTVLTAIQNACAVLPINRPDGVFAGQEREHFELQVLANTAADEIAKDGEWQRLKKIAVITGDGVAQDFDLPQDYDRMLKQAELRTARLVAPLMHVVSSDAWLDLALRPVSQVTGAWTLHDGSLHIKPAPLPGEEIRYFYMSDRWAVDKNGTAKAQFTADDDIFRLSEKLLELAMIWKWRANKGLAYAEDLANYEAAKEKLVTWDKGARMIVIGGAAASDAGLAYPRSIGA